MVALKTHFDGQQILTPPELKGAAPREVMVVIVADDEPAPVSRRPSVWDAIGKAPNPRTAEDIDQQVREERESWGDR